MGFLKKFTKQEISWMMYDWANSAHSVIVVTILPIFFDTVAGYTADSVSSMSTWGFATSLAMAIVALSAPFLGVFGRRAGVYPAHGLHCLDRRSGPGGGNGAGAVHPQHHRL